MARPKHSIAQRLGAAQVALDGMVENPEVRAVLAQFGYDDARMQEGRALYEGALALVAQQKMEYGEQWEATERVNEVWDEADEAYTDTLKIARIAFKGDRVGEGGLALDGERKNDLHGWSEQATLFYTNLLGDPALVAVLSDYGYTQAKLQQEAALVRAVAAANVAQEKERGDAQIVTKHRDAALREMDQWLSEFKGVAQVALADNPQALEKLGFGPIP